jgi:hypothetical protein
MEDGTYVVSFQGGLQTLKNMKYAYPRDYERVLDTLCTKQPTAIDRIRSTPDPTPQADDPDIQALIPPESLFQNYPDILHIISSRGLILYSSDNENDIGRNINDMTHPSDMIQLQRLMKTSSIGNSFSLALRLLKSEWQWYSISARKYELDNTKKTKCFIVSYREQQMDVLPNILDAQDTDIWGKCSETGLIVYTVENDGLYGCVLSALFDAPLVNDLLRLGRIGNVIGTFRRQQVIIRIFPLSHLFLFHVSHDLGLLNKTIISANVTDNLDSDGSYVYEANRIKMENKKLLQLIESYQLK